MPIIKSKVKNILIISLSNIGDVILTFPVIDILRSDFPDAEISIVTGPKPIGLLEGNTNFKNIYVFHKKHTAKWIIAWFKMLRQEKFDLAVDLRHTIIPLVLGIPKKTALIRRRIKNVHMKDKHLKILRTVYPYEAESKDKYCYQLSESNQKYIDDIFNRVGGKLDQLVIIAPGAADPKKRWNAGKISKVADHLIESKGFNVAFVGDTNDRVIAEEIQDQMKNDAIDLCGELTLAQLGGVIEKSKLMITNDTGPMHMACYLNKPVIAIFGPTDARKYGPWSSNSHIIKSKDVCLSCQAHEEREHTCMSSITAEQVKEKIDILFKNHERI